MISSMTRAAPIFAVGLQLRFGALLGQRITEDPRGMASPPSISDSYQLWMIGGLRSRAN